MRRPGRQTVPALRLRGGRHRARRHLPSLGRHLDVARGAECGGVERSQEPADPRKFILAQGFQKQGQEK